MPTMISSVLHWLSDRLSDPGQVSAVQERLSSLAQAIDERGATCTIVGVKTSEDASEVTCAMDDHVSQPPYSVIALHLGQMALILPTAFAQELEGALPAKVAQAEESEWSNDFMLEAGSEDDEDDEDE
jgi:hypothetical protein